jgi:TonB-linked SusC/RagA family outer membrane protein
MVTTTDNAGNFILKNVNENATVVITYIGYLHKEFKVGVDLGTIALEISNSKLDEVQVQAYGLTTRRLSTSNISTIKSKEISNQPINNPLLALSGRVAGLQITQSNGISGGGITVKIQGENSITAGTDPLYIIDGVPYLSQNLSGLSSSGLGGILGSGGNGGSGVVSSFGNPLSFINPGDIESIDILKDADATSIYGSRAANGAILITTKRGKVGKTEVSFKINQGWGEVPKKLDLLNTSQYLNMRLIAKRNDNSPISSTDYDINGWWDRTKNTDWQQELIGKKATYLDSKISISGGTENTQFLTSVGFHRETTVFPGTFSDRKGSLSTSINHQSNNKKFTFTMSGNFLFDNNKLPSEDLTSYAVNLAPDAPELYNPDGTINWMVNNAGSSTWTNPISFDYYNNNTVNSIINTTFRYRISSYLTANVSAGVNYLTSEETSLHPSTKIKPENLPFEVSSALYSNGVSKAWIIEPNLSFNKEILGVKVETILGTTLQQQTQELKILNGIGYNNDLVLNDIGAASQIIVNDRNYSDYRYNALFARVNINKDDRYILNLSGRRDGTSRFGSQNRFQNFQSVGVAWIFSNEPILENAKSFLSFGKLKLSYGTTGNDQIGNYSYLSTYSNPVSGTYQNGNTLAPSNISNPYLQWEETRKLQMGIDVGVFRDRVLLSATVFRNRSSNLLLGYDLPAITGFTSINSNFPARIQNSGIELTINTINIKGAKLRWESNFNLTLPSNKLLSFENLRNSSYANVLVVGQPFTLTKLFNYTGVDPRTGLYLFSDKNGNPTSTPNSLTDKTILENRSPVAYGGLSNHISFKGLSLDFLLQFSKQKALTYKYGGGIPGIAFRNQPTSILGAWTAPGDISMIQRYNSNFNPSVSTALTRLRASNAAFTDASFLKLKNVAINYQLPKAWTEKINVNYASIFFQGENLWTLSNYIGLDPETKSNTTLPILRVLTLGLQITL